MALGDERNLLSEAQAEEAGTAEAIIGLTQQCLSEAGILPAEISGLVVALGPGSFTGIRTGLASAQGISRALAIPITGLSVIFARSLCWAADSLGREAVPEKVFLSWLKSSPSEITYSLFKVRERKECNNAAPLLQVLSGLELLSYNALESKCESLSEVYRQEVCAVNVDIADGDIARKLKSPAAMLLRALPGLGNSDRCKEELAGHLQSSATGGLGLKPLYAKGTSARTLVERGIK